MSDLTATNCGCNNGNDYNTANFFGGNSCIWIILLLLFCNGNDNGCGRSGLFGRGGNNGGCCEWIILLLILSSCCGNN